MTQVVELDQNRIAPDLAPVIVSLCAAARDLARLIATGPLSASSGNTSDGDVQQSIDLGADTAFRTALSGTAVRWFASEERCELGMLNPDGHLGLALDPLNGSGDLDANAPIGTIFGIMPAADDPNATFLRPGSDMLAAGYFIYGPQTALVATFGSGVQQFILDPSTGTFRQVADKRMPDEASEFAINASNYRHWSKPIRAYIDDCIAGADGPRAEKFDMRWMASLVAETHRIVSRGGIFLYPGDKRPGHAQGRLRLVYECAPIAMLVEQAGGRATDGTHRILDLTPASLQARTPFIFGNIDKVDRVTAYHDLPDQEVSALFGTRGLFRV